MDSNFTLKMEKFPISGMIGGTQVKPLTRKLSYLISMIKAIQH
jgi:hypothetical protein